MVSPFLRGLDCMWSDAAYTQRPCPPPSQTGLAGIALAGAVVPPGLWIAVSAAAGRQAMGIARPFEFSLYNLLDIVVFSIAFGWAIYDASGRIEWHRRLMFFALLNLFGPARRPDVESGLAHRTRNLRGHPASRASGSFAGFGSRLRPGVWAGFEFRWELYMEDRRRRKFRAK